MFRFREKGLSAALSMFLGLNPGNIFNWIGISRILLFCLNSIFSSSQKWSSSTYLHMTGNPKAEKKTDKSPKIYFTCRLSNNTEQVITLDSILLLLFKHLSFYHWQFVHVNAVSWNFLMLKSSQLIKFPQSVNGPEMECINRCFILGSGFIGFSIMESQLRF